MKSTRRLFIGAVFGFLSALPILAENCGVLPDVTPEPQPEPVAQVDMAAGPLSPKRKAWAPYNRNELVQFAAQSGDAGNWELGTQEYESAQSKIYRFNQEV